MTKTEIDKVLADHKKWLENKADGSRADLRNADLRNADLSSADLRSAELRDADLRHANLCDADLRLSDLCGADLRHADLRYADLRHSGLCDTDLRHADLRHAGLRNANLRNVDLRGADLDYSSWPLGCGSLDVKVDKRIAAQLLYHALRAMMSYSDEPDVAAVLSNEACLHLANQFHRVDECGEVGLQKREDEKKDSEMNEKCEKYLGSRMK